jgi:hypothetical protein
VFERCFAWDVYYPIELLQFSKLQICLWDKLSKCQEMQDIGGMKIILLVAVAVSLIGSLSENSGKIVKRSVAKEKATAYVPIHPRAQNATAYVPIHPRAQNALAYVPIRPRAEIA